MKTKTINIYEYSELTPKAKEKALDHFRQHEFDDYGLRVHLDNHIETLLEEKGIKPIDGTYAKICYSLAHCQGDGAMFEGTFDFKGHSVTVVQSGRYSHSYSKEVTWNDFSGEEKESSEEKTAQEFETAYQSICKELEKEGYAFIEDVESEAYFIETCNANEWTFREDGTREDL